MPCAAPAAAGSRTNATRSSSSIVCNWLAAVTGRLANDAGGGLEGPHRRQEEVARRPQQPVDRERRRVEEPGAQVGREHERHRQRHRDEDEEQQVHERHHVRGGARPEHVVEQDARVVAGEQRAVDVLELVVEQLLGAQQRDDALEVAVGEVAGEEAQQRDAHGQHPGRGPALAADGHERLARRAPPRRAARGAHADVDHDEAGDEQRRDPQAARRHPVGIAQRQPGRARGDERGDQRGDRDRRPAQRGPPPHPP